MGSCDIFTTKAVASDRKLYKTIDQHLDTILQENENYNATLQQQQAAPETNQSPCSSPFYSNRGIATLFGSKREEYLLVNTIAIITLTTVMAIAVITITILDLMVLLQQLFPKVPS